MLMRLLKFGGDANVFSSFLSVQASIIVEHVTAAMMRFVSLITFTFLAIVIYWWPFDTFPSYSNISYQSAWHIDQISTDDKAGRHTIHYDIAGSTNDGNVCRTNNDPNTFHLLLLHLHQQCISSRNQNCNVSQPVRKQRPSRHSECSGHWHCPERHTMPLSTLQWSFVTHGVSKLPSEISKDFSK